MAASLNKVMIIGNLGQDPELRSTQSGTQVTTLRIATHERWTSRDGEDGERTEWHSVVVFGRQAENCATYLSKGRSVFVEGRLQTRKWEDRDGNDRYTTEIVANNIQFLSGKGEGNFGGGGGGGDYNRSSNNNNNNRGSSGRNDNFNPAFDDDDIPF